MVLEALKPDPPATLGIFACVYSNCSRTPYGILPGSEEVNQAKRTQGVWFLVV